MSRLLNMESNLTQPNYLSSLIFELRKNANGSSFVQIKRRNSSYTEPLRLIPVQIDGLTIYFSFFIINTSFHVRVNHLTLYD
jgi:hypothetical protein